MTILGLKPEQMPKTPAHFDVERVIRPNILSLHPYRCARDDYQEGILVDANENSLGHSIVSNGVSQNVDSVLLDPTQNLHRYPDPSHPEIKSRIAKLRGLPGPDHVFLGVGSDEVIDLLMRICVAPEREKILISPPTYGMYSVCAQVNDIGVVKVPLELTGEHGEGGEKGRFSVRIEDMQKAVSADPSIKLVFVCSPGNPTGTSIPLKSIRQLLDYEPFKGIVVVDEAYIDFAGEDISAATLVTEYANLCVMQTLSKSFGLAAIRLGVALAHPALIQVLSNTKAPYNISTPTAALALAALSKASLESMRSNVATLLAQRDILIKGLSSPDIQALGLGGVIGGNDANFLMIPILERDSGSKGKPDNARAQLVYKTLAEKEGVVVRFRGNEPGCTACLRISVGTEEENRVIVAKLRDVLSRM